MCVHCMANMSMIIGWMVSFCIRRIQLLVLYWKIKCCVECSPKQQMKVDSQLSLGQWYFLDLQMQNMLWWWMLIHNNTRLMFAYKIHLYISIKFNWKHILPLYVANLANNIVVKWTWTMFNIICASLLPHIEFYSTISAIYWCHTCFNRFIQDH